MKKKMVYKKVLNLCKAVIISTALSFLGFFLLNAIVRALVAGHDNINVFLYCFSMIMYALWFYVVRTKKRDALYSSSGEFKILNEIKYYIAEDGKFLLSIYVVLAFICEISYLIVPANQGNFFATMCSMCFPFFSSINIPILRSMVSVILAFSISLLLEVFNSYSINNIKNKGD